MSSVMEFKRRAIPRSAASGFPSGRNCASRAQLREEVNGVNMDTRCLYCGFDLDPPGEAMAQAMIALHPSIQRLRPSAKDWNEVLRQRA